VVGRYVTVVIPEEKKTLTLCEVEVYGTSVLGMWRNPTSQSISHYKGKSVQPSSDPEFAFFKCSNSLKIYKNNGKFDRTLRHYVCNNKVYLTVSICLLI
jgi:hypothetical protein